VRAGCCRVPLPSPCARGMAHPPACLPLLLRRICDPASDGSAGGGPCPPHAPRPRNLTQGGQLLATSCERPGALAPRAPLATPPAPQPWSLVRTTAAGLVLKSLDGPGSGYEPSKRSDNWIKVRGRGAGGEGREGGGAAASSGGTVDIIGQRAHCQRNLLCSLPLPPGPIKALNKGPQIASTPRRSSATTAWAFRIAWTWCPLVPGTALAGRWAGKLLPAAEWSEGCLLLPHPASSLSLACLHTTCLAGCLLPSCQVTHTFTQQCAHA